MLFLTYSSRCLPTLPVGPLAQSCTTLQPATVPPQIVGQHLMPGKAKPCIVYSRGGVCSRSDPLPPTLNSCPRQVLHPSKTDNSQTLPPFLFSCFQNRNVI